MKSLSEVQDDFIARWGILGTQWGVSKAMAQVQALLITSQEPLNTDQIMQRLSISRGNAHGGLKELLNWELARKILVKGERKDYFEAEKDPWKIFFIVARERRRKEVKPLLEALRQCETDAGRLKDDSADVFHQQMGNFIGIVEMADAALGTLATAEKPWVSRWLLKLIGRQKGK